MSTRTERIFGRTARGIMWMVNPIKKMVIQTHCMAHKYINNKALDLLLSEGHKDAHKCLNKYIKDINEGVTWADQDFKSSNHFYHFSDRRGLYGFSNALNECKKYYNLSLKYLELGDIPLSAFYFGAAVHLIQDATVPHHVNNKLLKQHREFELWIISKIVMGHHFEAKDGIKRYRDIEEYIHNNALSANSAHYRFKSITNIDERYCEVASVIIQEAQITTAGFMLDYYEKLREKTEC